MMNYKKFFTRKAVILRISILVIIVLFCQIARSQAPAIKHVGSVIDAYPVMSPDGSTILFESNRDGNFEIYTMDVHGKNMKRLTTDTAFDGTPSWSPDGKWIVFASERDHDSEIYVMKADGSSQTRLTSAPGDDSHPHFSPDGKSIIFCSARSTPDLKADWGKQWIEIFTMNIDGSSVKQISSFKTVSTFPSISPNGKHIVFRKVIDAPATDWEGNATQRNSEVFVMDINGENAINLSKNKSFDGWPVWMPDSRHVVYASSGEPHTAQIIITDLDGNNKRSLTNGPGSFVQPSISSDGHLLLAYHFYETADFEFGGVAMVKIQ